MRFELREGWFSFLREPLPSGRASHSPGLCEHYTLLDRSLLPELPRLLNPEGVAILELGAGQARTVTELAGCAGLASELRQDLAGLPRVIVLRRVLP